MLRLALFLTFILCATPSLALENHSTHGNHGSHHEKHIIQKFTLEFLDQPKLETGKAARLSVLLKDPNGHPVSEKQLEEVHTKKFHLLVIDPDLGEYHHLHPKPTETPGVYAFEFTPETSVNFRAWADIKPVGSTQQYLPVDIGTVTEGKIKDEIQSLQTSIDGYDFELSFNKTPLKPGDITGKVTISEKGRPVTRLEPVMGAFAHVVGFTEDLSTVIHAHPMGREPASQNKRGGPEFSFHISPESKGLIKLFVQVSIDGKSVFAPFLINIE